MNLINKYFQLDKAQLDLFVLAKDLYLDWNQKINLISRKDVDNIELHHFLHSLAIYKMLAFKPESKILDLGCGGGFPGIMLAIMMPEVTFTLIDARRKKIMVVNEVVKALGIKNVKAIHGRAEELKNQQFDFIVTRAVASIDKLKFWSEKLISADQKHILPNGIIALKGGDLKDEVALLNKKDYYEITPISNFFEEEYFEEKFILYLQL